MLRPVAPLALPSAITRDWAYGDGTGVDVAVIDSGIQADHPAVRGVASAAVFTPDPSVLGGVRVDEGQHDDLFGHGTACAGIIRTLAPGCRLHSLRVLGERLTGKGPVFAAALRYAIDAGMQVVNLSLSTSREDYLPLFHELADAAYFAGTILVCAVNNLPQPSYPSEFASVISVAAHDGTDPERFSYNPDPPIEFGAPGIDVEVPWAGSGAVRVTGNSFAAPHLAGHVARMLSRHPGLAPFQVKTVLHALAENAVGGPVRAGDEPRL